VGWRIAAAIVALLPRAALRVIGALLGVIAFDVLRIRRAHVLSSMERAGIGGVRDARRMFVSLGTGALEILWLAGRSKTKLVAPDGMGGGMARIDGLDVFERANAKGRGVVVVTAHTGNWDVSACACAEKTALTVVTKRLSARGLDAFWQSTRTRRGVRLVAPGVRGVPAETSNVIKTLREDLGAGRTIALLVDQDPERTTSVVEADFLGAPALHDTLPATLAARAGAPIVIAFARREGSTHVVDILRAIDPPPRASAKWIEETTRAIAAELDAFVRRDPSVWLWLHRRWKSRRAAKPGADARTDAIGHNAAQVARP
jgi:KDO2-lipid IV(A) lauroyltransferase